MGAWDTLLLTLQRRRTRNLAIAATLATLATTQVLLVTPRHLLPWGSAGEEGEGPRPYYPLQATDTNMAKGLANSLASMKGVREGREWREEEDREKEVWEGRREGREEKRDGRGRAPLLTVPTRRADHEQKSGGGGGRHGGRRGDRPGEARAVGVEGGLQQVVRSSLARHGAGRVSRERRREGRKGRDDEEIVVGEEVGRVRELGIDHVGKGKEAMGASLGDMLKTGLNTFNTIQGLARAVGGKGGKGGSGGSGGSSLASMVGSLLLPPGKAQWFLQ